VDYLELLESGLNTPGENDFVVDEHGNVVRASKPKTFWEDPAMLAPVLDLVAKKPENFANVVTRDWDKASILVRTNLSGSRAIEQTLARIREYVAARFPAELRVRLTGNLVLITGTASDIVRRQIQSLAPAPARTFVLLTPTSLLVPT